jgi:hypothetical protein
MLQESFSACYADAMRCEGIPMTEEDLEQLSEDWPRMREEISLLKKQNSELREI